MSGPSPAWLRWTRLAARVRIEELRAQWTMPRSLHGLVDDVLADGEGDHGPRDAGALAAARDAASGEPRWRHVVDSFGLTALEEEWLALLATVHVEPAWSRVLGYLDDDPDPARPTPALATALWDWPAGAQPGPGGALIAWGLATPAQPDPWLATTPWAIDADVVGYLCGAPGWPAFWPGVEHVQPATTSPGTLYPDALEAMWQVARALPDADVELELVGASGSGRRTLLRQLCDMLGRDALVISSTADPVRALRTARLLDAVAVWVDAEPPADAGARALTLVARRAPRSQPSRAVRMSWTLPDLSRDARLALWGALTDEPAPAAIAEWPMTPAEITTAAAAAPAGQLAVAAVARKRLGTLSSQLLTPVRCAYDWDDLVVSDGVRSQLREIERQVRNSATVLDDWGFRRLTPASSGVTALLAGPSGTGKTMAAQVLAQSLELDLFQVNLAEVVNKYIGETEKRLAEVFDECERASVMVLFDEADALFGQRTRVRDAHDRFANIEIDYLLQRMESFDGVAILATNRRGDLDPAFLRRIRVIVDFLAPTVPERQRLWELAIPAAAPSGIPIANGIDRRLLAEELALTGAEIKSIALAAAFNAHGDGELIGNAHVLAAARRELAKRGTVLRGTLAESIPAGAR